MFASPPTASELSHRRINALCQQPTSSEDGVRGFALEGRSINTDRAGGPTPSRGLAVKATCGEAGATPLESRLSRLGRAFPPALPTLARVRLQRLSPIGNCRNRLAVAENAANFFS